MSEEGNRNQLSAAQKMSLYLITLFVAAFVYVGPHISTDVWKFLLLIPIVAIGGGLLVGAFAIYMALRVGRKVMDMKWVGKFGGRESEGPQGPVIVGRWSSPEGEEKGRKK